MGLSSVGCWAYMRFCAWRVVRLKVRNCLLILLDREVWKGVWARVTFPRIFPLHIVCLVLRLARLLLRESGQPNWSFLSLGWNLLVWVLLGRSEYLAECSSRMYIILVRSLLLQIGRRLYELILALEHLIRHRGSNHGLVSLERLIHIISSSWQMVVTLGNTTF